MNPLLAVLESTTEDRFTAALEGVLVDETFLGRFLELATGQPIPAATLPTLRLTRQFSVEDGRADLAIEGTGCSFIVEVKLGAQFTAGQPHNYARYLQERRAAHGGPITLVLLVPAHQLAGYLKEAEERLKRHGIDAVPVRGVSWEDVAKLGRAHAQATGLSTSAVRLSDFAELIDYHVGTLERPLLEDEALVINSPKVARALRETMAVLDPVQAAMAKRVGDATWALKAGGYFFTGWNFTRADRKGWFGFWVEPWAFWGESPLWVQLRSGPRLRSTSTTALRVRQWKDGTDVVALPLLPRLTLEEQVAQLSDRGVAILTAS